MSLRRVQLSSLPDKVFEQLLSEIVTGRFFPGQPLPSERELTSVLGVNRHVVREAVKRLEQLGLLSVNQGGRTKVLNFRRTAGLDLLAVIAEHAHAIEPQPELFAATLEMRAGIGVDLVSLCAQRAERSVREDLVQIAAELAAVGGGAAILPLDERFWQRVLDGAGNLAYQLAFNSLIRAVHAIRDVSLPWLEHELLRSGHRRPLAAAIAAADAPAAEKAARAALAVPPGAIALLTEADASSRPQTGRSVSA
ncbi:MAG: FadR/GntR family transcriptional regulator [Solirubrobacteraceae bacterium]